ncbi:hypothetical protein SAMN04487895_12750 [Paenibacillus sophorae]|uniref:Uncharacterized protein n=1 Tax=Paenibacillus sophorae TaxID=1333845 RepID=A0A1H8VTD3_9BACL|nr:hypothetical protein [Paenibacillus sophorae]QWU15702.1 hypothetical protein KP014_28465 [Paenibacillus sophorae]SEP18692.1 hypothetical protein SAMN04487895_12750 [Paenibacillus sophorae]
MSLETHEYVRPPMLPNADFEDRYHHLNYDWSGFYNQPVSAFMKELSAMDSQIGYDAMLELLEQIVWRIQLGYEIESFLMTVFGEVRHA